MIRRDYLQRQIDQLGKAMGKLLSDMMDLKKQGKTSLAIETVSQTLRTAVDFDLGAMLGIPEGNFLEKMQHDKKMDRYHLDTLADILYESAVAYEDLALPEKAEGLFKRAKILYEYLNETDTTYSFARLTKVQKIQKKYGL